MGENPMPRNPKRFSAGSSAEGYQDPKAEAERRSRWINSPHSCILSCFWEEVKEKLAQPDVGTWFIAFDGVELSEKYRSG